MFSSPSVARADKVILYDTLVLSVLLYGAGTWRSLTSAEHSSLANAYHQMAFSMLRPLYTVEEARHIAAQRALALLGLPSMDTLLHLARLRHLQSCVTVGIEEFWALAHAEAQWLQSVQLSLAWLADLVGFPSNAPDPCSAWPFWRDMILQTPAKWKGLIKKAQHRAVRREAWTSAAVYHQGLLSRQLRLAGGFLIGDRPEEWDARQCCAPCGKTFPSLQAWSVHAFKVHGRVTIGRGMLTGSRCECCLRHFGTNLKLCRHLAYSTNCRQRLQTAGFQCPVEPGQGSRKAEDSGKNQMPAVQAAGPALPLQPEPWLAEADRPVAEVLRAMQHLLSDDSVSGDSSLWNRARIAFGCVCATTRRLRATALACLRQLDDSADAPSPRQLAVGDILRWIADADLVEWLVPVSITTAPPLQTFRDGALLLQTLEVAAIQLPLASAGLDFTFLGVGPSAWCRDLAARPDMVCYDTEECLSILAANDPLPFLTGPFDQVAFVFALGTWQGFMCPPPPHAPTRFCSISLAQETLQSDLVRFAFKLWTLGVPACLLFKPMSLSSLSPLP